MNQQLETWFDRECERRQVSKDLIDFHALTDSSLNLEENKDNK